jgi:hypothetical protein
MLTVDLPPGAWGLLVVAWSPPAFIPALAAALLGVVLAVGLAAGRLHRRRSVDRREPPSTRLFAVDAERVAAR